MKNQNTAYKEKIKSKPQPEAQPQSVEDGKMEILYFLQWDLTWEEEENGFNWTAWAYLSEMNDRARTQLLNDAEAAGLIFKTERI